MKLKNVMTQRKCNKKKSQPLMRMKQTQMSLLKNPLHYFVIQSAHGSVQIAMEYGSTQQNNKKIYKEPVTVKEAISSSESEKWKEAMEKEMRSIEANEVWELVELPKWQKDHWMQMGLQTQAWC